MEQILLGTSETCDFYSYENYLSYCQENGIEPKDKNSYDYYEWINGEEQWDYINFFGNLVYGKAYKEFYTIEYNLGLWNGRKEGYISKVFQNLSDAIEYALQSSRDYNDYKVTFEDGMIFVYGYHHDGTNIFKIRQVSKIGKKRLAKGTDGFVENIDCKSYYKKMNFNDIF